MTDEQFSLLTPSLLQGRPNTYTLTKAMAENLLQEEASDLPVAIIRPSIIGAAAKEPLPVSYSCSFGICNITWVYNDGFLHAYAERTTVKGQTKACCCITTYTSCY